MADHGLSGLSAPSLSDIETLAAEAYARLPEAFRALCGDVLIRVEDFPSEDVMDDMKAGPFDLLGLFQGVGLDATRHSAVSPPSTTNADPVT